MYKVFSSRLKMCYPTLVDVLKKSVWNFCYCGLHLLLSYPTVREGRKGVWLPHCFQKTVMCWGDEFNESASYFSTGVSESHKLDMKWGFSLERQPHVTHYQSSCPNMVTETFGRWCWQTSHCTAGQWHAVACGLWLTHSHIEVAVHEYSPQGPGLE